MSTIERTVQVTLALPQDVYDRVAETAATEERRLEDVLSTLIADGLDTHATLREAFERLSADYRARLAREGKLNRSPDEILQELRDLREQIASELYP